MPRFFALPIGVAGGLQRHAQFPTRENTRLSGSLAMKNSYTLNAVVLQKTTLGYAYRLGGVDCRAVLKGGQCHNPNTVAAHASYAFNNYYQKNNMAPRTYDFGGNAIITQTNLSYGTCLYTTCSSTATTPTTSVTTPTTLDTALTMPTTTPTTLVTTPTAPTTTLLYDSNSHVGNITTPMGGITRVPTSLGASSSFNTTSYSDTSSSFTYLGSSFTLLMSVDVVVIL
ncbi:hypothetical protein SUGI_0129290 [Cryptomeria japonica]|nr:hypothetical protein SUGI_0129290 [Cryptomeria japonica]